MDIPPQIRGRLLGLYRRAAALRRKQSFELTIAGIRP